MIKELLTNEDLSAYKEWLISHPQNNLWQSLERKQYLEAIGKTVRIFTANDDDKIVASAMVMVDRTSFGFSTWDIARGPLWKEGFDDVVGKLIEHIAQEAKKDKCLALYLSPYEELQITSYQPSPRLRLAGKLQVSPRYIQAEATRIIDITKSEEEILSQMHSKGRYNIKVAKKHGVTVEKSNDIDAYFELAKKTGVRDKFTIQTKEKYQEFLKNLPGAFLLLAYKEAEEAREEVANCKLQVTNYPIAGLLGVTYGKSQIYYYGASNYDYRAFMAPFLLQWETILYAKEKGCTSYDLLGIAPLDAGDCHPWKGISSFKEKFGGNVVSYPKEKMIVLKPVLNKLIEYKRKVFS